MDFPRWRFVLVGIIFIHNQKPKMKTHLIHPDHRLTGAFYQSFPGSDIRPLKFYDDGDIGIYQKDHYERLDEYHGESTHTEEITFTTEAW
jgi:hypothetical protein